MQTIFEDSVAKKWRLDRAPTLIARKDTGFPIAFTRLQRDASGTRLTREVPAETVFSFTVALAPMAASTLWIDGKHHKIAPIPEGETVLYDLTRNLIGDFPPPFDYLRFYLPVSTMDQLAYENGLRSVGGLSAAAHSVRDEVMVGLAHAMRAALERPETVPTLFTDAIALAFHSHVIRTYGTVLDAKTSSRAGLAPWQLRRACDMIEARLDDDPTIAELAEACGLSPSYFSRGFRQATGMPPHRWLIRQRVERAKLLLRQEGTELAEIALACGFADQSHMTRNFTQIAGCSPSRWRRSQRRS